MTLPNAVTALITAGRLERVPADLPNARARLSRAEDKLAAAAAIAEIDIEIAYLTTYDATRVAATAHMLSIGYRVRAVARAHEAVGTYAEAMPSATPSERDHRHESNTPEPPFPIGPWEGPATPAGHSVR